MLRDMLFCVLYVGDEHLVRELVWLSMCRLGADWGYESIKDASLQRLRVLFFLLADRDMALKEKLLDGWKEMCVPGVDKKKAGGFFAQLRVGIIEPWLIDERRTESDFVSAVTDLYLVC
jgi:hypothetical protein